ncbi:MAG TPA: deoxyribonuclease V [Ktedonobacterales bacterium]|nr:deoxyribonuclease V [Ktedonobacterales bacterium]
MSQPQMLHSWNLSPQEAMQVQRELAGKVIREDQLGEVKVIAGIDISANDRTGLARAAIVALAYPSLDVLERIRHEEPLRFPYIPGLLSFREVPSILAGFQQLRNRPDLLMVDGQGIAHPRRIGIASHLGVLLDLPSIGCAKSILTGKLSGALGEEVGARVPLMAGVEVLGMGIRTKARTNPMIISIGHRVSLETAVSYALSCCRGYRLPEPTRQAHNTASISGEGHDIERASPGDEEIQAPTLWEC